MLVYIYKTDRFQVNWVGIVNLHPSKGTHWVAYINEICIDRYGWAHHQKQSMFIIKRSGSCVCSEYKIQGLTNKRALIVQVIVYIYFIYQKLWE